MPRKQSLNLVKFDAANVDLTVGINNLIKGIQHQNPGMNIQEVQSLGNALLGQAGKALRQGERLASVKLKPDGNFDIDIWHINPRKDG